MNVKKKRMFCSYRAFHKPLTHCPIPLCVNKSDAHERGADNRKALYAVKNHPCSSRLRPPSASDLHRYFGDSMYP